MTVTVRKILALLKNYITPCGWRGYLKIAHQWTGFTNQATSPAQKAA